MCIYVYDHIRARIYLQGYVEYVCGHMYFVWEPLIQPSEYKWRWSDKEEPQLKRASTLLSHLLGCLETYSLTIFLSGLWVAHNP